MKKALLLSAAVLVLAIAACGPANAPAITTESSMPTPFAPFAEEEMDVVPTIAAVSASPTRVEAAVPIVTSAPALTTGATAGMLPPGTEGRPLTALGNPSAPVVIVEYSDFQCPFCRRHFLETMPQLQTDYIDTGRVYYIFKDFPIAGLHPLAYRLHEAALCAGEAGGSEAFWEAHDLFFTQAERFEQNGVAAMDGAILSELARAELPDIVDCLRNSRFQDEVERTIAEGQSLGVRGTPTFFINGNLFVGAQSMAAFAAAIEQVESGAALAAAPAAPPPQLAVIPTPATITSREVTAIGDPDAPVTIVEYSDFQCPFCRRHVQQTMPLLKENFIDTGRVYYVFKDFPIDSLHPLAYRLHEAALCAGQRGDVSTYWQAHDLFFAEAERFQVESEGEMDVVILAAFAEYDLPDISACLADNGFSEAVQAGIAEGLSLGVNGTPAFFINGYPVSGAQPYDLFAYAIGLAETGELATAYQRTGPNDGKAQATATAQAARPVDIPLCDNNRWNS